MDYHNLLQKIEGPDKQFTDADVMHVLIDVYGIPHPGRRRTALQRLYGGLRRREMRIRQQSGYPSDAMKGDATAAARRYVDYLCGVADEFQRLHKPGRQLLDSEREALVAAKRAGEIGEVRTFFRETVGYCP